MGEATKGEGFSSSLVYALIVLNNCTVRPEKICTGGDNFLISFPSRPAPSGEPGFEASAQGAKVISSYSSNLDTNALR